MELAGRVIVITGAASGIGRALALRFAEEAPAHIVCVDIDSAGAEATAAEVGGTAFRVDVAREAEIVDSIPPAIVIAMRKVEMLLSILSMCFPSFGEIGNFWRIKPFRPAFFANDKPVFDAYDTIGIGQGPWIVRHGQNAALLLMGNPR